MKSFAIKAFAVSAIAGGALFATEPERVRILREPRRVRGPCHMDAYRSDPVFQAFRVLS